MRLRPPMERAPPSMSSHAADRDREPAPTPRPGVDLAGYRTTRELLRANPSEFKLDAPAAVVPGYLGVEIVPGPRRGQLYEGVGGVTLAEGPDRPALRDAAIVSADGQARRVLL